MNISKIFKNLIPSYRVGQSILKEMNNHYNCYNNLSRNINKLSEQIKNLDEKNEFLFWLLKKYENETGEDVKKRVFLEMPKATGDLRKIQLAENYILQRVKDICDKNDIHFWLGYGTLIGAIRHHGFIPWDDDIDICMLKQDCDKLFAIIKNDMELDVNKYFLLNEASYLIKVKFKNDDSVYIDIFTFDFVDCASSEDATVKFDETQKIVNECQAYNSILLNNNCQNWSNKERPFICDKIINNVDENYNQAIKQIPYYGHGKYIGKSLYMATGFRASEKYRPLDWYFPLCTNSVEFEGKNYDAPANYDAILKNMYGDIWSLPSSIRCIHDKEFTGYEDILKSLNL